MKQQHFTEAQIMGILKQPSTGGGVHQLWRKHGMSETYYRYSPIRDEDKAKIADL